MNMLRSYPSARLLEEESWRLTKLPLEAGYRLELNLELFKIYFRKGSFRKALSWLYKAKSGLGTVRDREYVARKHELIDLMLLKMLLQFDEFIRSSEKQGVISLELQETKLAKTIILEKMITGGFLKLLEKNSDNVGLIAEVAGATVHRLEQFGASQCLILDF
jgi:hypothetical protein